MTRSRKAALVLVLGVVVVHVATMPKERMTGDPMVPRTAARALVFEGTLEVSRVIGGGGGGAAYAGNFTQKPATQRLYSKWGVANTLFFVPPTLAYRLLKGRVSLSNNTLYLLCLNSYNVVLSALIALLLFALAGLYSERLSLRLGYVLLTLYGSYSWYYLRAQSIDIFHLALFLAYAYSVLRLHRQLRWATLLAAAALLALLIHARVAFGLFLPALALSILLAARREAMPWRHVLRLAAPAVALLLGALVALLLLNKYKFGAYFATGYHQGVELTQLPFFERAPLSTLYIHLFDLQRGLFVHFPLAALGLVLAPRFFRERRSDAIFIAAHVVPYVLVLTSISHIWHGEWAYGPRLMLVLAPLLALPCYLAFAETISTVRKKVLAYALITVGAFSFTYQLKVISRPFHAYYLLDALFQRYPHPRYTYRLSRFFSRTHVGEIYDSVLSFASGEPTNKALELIRLYNAKAVPELTEILEREHFKQNFYFF